MGGGRGRGAVVVAAYRSRGLVEDLAGGVPGTVCGVSPGPAVEAAGGEAEEQG